MERIFNTILGILIFYILFLIYPIIIKIKKEKFPEKGMSIRMLINSGFWIGVAFILLISTSFTLADFAIILFLSTTAYFVNINILKNNIIKEKSKSNIKEAYINPIVFAPYILLLIISILGFNYIFTSKYFVNNNMPEFNIIIMICLFYILVWSILKIIQVTILKFTTKLEISNQKIIGKKGWLNIVLLDAPLTKINDVMITQSLFGKIFNYSTITINTSSSKYKFYYIENAFDFKNYLTDLIDKKPIKTIVSANKYDDLKKIKELLDENIITKEEFEREKKKLLK